MFDFIYIRLRTLNNFHFNEYFYQVFLLVFFFINSDDDGVKWSSWKVGEVYPPRTEQCCESTTSRKPELNPDQVLSHCKSETFRDESRKRIQMLETRLNECSIIDMPVKHTPLETQYPLAFSILFHRCLWLMISYN